MVLSRLSKNTIRAPYTYTSGLGQVVQLEKITLVDADMPPIVEEEEEKEDAASPAAKASKDSEEVSTDPSTPDAEASPKVAGAAP